TVREFGWLRLAEAGEDAEAREAQRRWAAGYARVHGPQLAGPGQFAAIDALSAEETNLADEMRGAMADGDLCSFVELLAALGMFWPIRGEHARLMVLVQAVADVVGDWQPPPDLAEPARAAIAITLANSLMASEADCEPLRAVLQRWGVDAAID